MTLIAILNSLMAANLMGRLFNLNFAKGIVLNTSRTKVTAIITMKSSFPDKSINRVDAIGDRNKTITKRKMIERNPTVKNEVENTLSLSSSRDANLK